MNRRSLLTGAFATTAALALGVTLYRPELESMDDADSDEHRELFAVLLPVLLDGALPQMASPRQAAIERTLDAIAQTMAILPDDQRAELELLLSGLENRFGALLLTGSFTPLLLRSPAQLVTMLEDWRDGFLEMQQQAYYGLRELVMASYYACPEHWGAMHYAKPRLG